MRLPASFWKEYAFARSAFARKYAFARLRCTKKDEPQRATKKVATKEPKQKAKKPGGKQRPSGS
jgi:hypothetical protein